MADDVVYALTSIPPPYGDNSYQRACLQSWTVAGLEIRSFNHPSEIPAIQSAYGVCCIPVTETGMSRFGRHYARINAMLDWAGEHLASVLLINADIELRISREQLQRIRWLGHGGLVYWARYNHDGDPTRATREPSGLDMFLLSGRDAFLMPRAFLCMGQPFWDYWLPHAFSSHERVLHSVGFPAGYHRNHVRNWSDETWYQCGLEFDRMYPTLDDHDRSPNAVSAMSIRLRQHFDSISRPIAQVPMPIRQWVEQRFSRRGDKVFLELGANSGDDTKWMASLPGVYIHSFEPDPRNEPPVFPNVTLSRMAIADQEGRMPFVLSKEGWGQIWTQSSSLKQPKNHLQRYPVSFGETIEIDATSLDIYCARNSLGLIDFIWADVQGVEGEMVKGGRRTLERTRYLYTEYSNDEMYEGQATLQDILDLLPQFRVLELWPDNVLLVNRNLQSL